MDTQPNQNHNQTEPVRDTDKLQMQRQTSEDDDAESTDGFDNAVNFYLHEEPEEDQDEDDLGNMMYDTAEVVAHAIVESGIPSPPDGNYQLSIR